VLSSSLGTIDAGVKRLLDSSADGPPQAARARLALEQSTETARHGLERIQGLVESLRDFSRLDDAEAQQADLREELDTVLSLIDSQLIGGVEIIKNYQAIEPIECKPRELNQAFLTILTNAFEALRGRGRLTLGLERRGHELLLTIADTGPGIAAPLLPHLFDVSLSHKGERVAMRMGLPAARLIVERHGGRIAVASDLGRGTTFSISLPLKA
jgi:two-component system, NtrC family, sensor kinase